MHTSPQPHTPTPPQRTAHGAQQAKTGKDNDAYPTSKYKPPMECIRQTCPTHGVPTIKPTAPEVPLPTSWCQTTQHNTTPPPPSLVAQPKWLWLIGIYLDHSSRMLLPGVNRTIVYLSNRVSSLRQSEYFPRGKQKQYLTVTPMRQCVTAIIPGALLS